MDSLNLGIMIGLWIGIYMMVHIWLKNKNNQPSEIIFKNKSNDELVRDLLKISQSIDKCIETIIDQDQENSTKTIIYYDELLTQQMLKLDQISNPDLKPLRKETIRCLQRTIDMLI